MWVVTCKPCGSPAASHSRCVSAIPSAETSHIATLQASAASWRTSSRPIPEPPPVTTAILPAKSFISPLSLFCQLTARSTVEVDQNDILRRQTSAGFKFIVIPVQAGVQAQGYAPELDP